MSCVYQLVKCVHLILKMCGFFNKGWVYNLLKCSITVSSSELSAPVFFYSEKQTVQGYVAETSHTEPYFSAARASSSHVTHQRVLLAGPMQVISNILSVTIVLSAPEKSLF